MVITVDSDSTDPGSIPGTTSSFYFFFLFGTMVEYHLGTQERISGGYFSRNRMGTGLFEDSYRKPTPPDFV